MSGGAGSCNVSVTHMNWGSSPPPHGPIVRRHYVNHAPLTAVTRCTFVPRTWVLMFARTFRAVSLLLPLRGFHGKQVCAKSRFESLWQYSLNPTRSSS